MTVDAGAAGAGSLRPLAASFCAFSAAFFACNLSLARATASCFAASFSLAVSTLFGAAADAAAAATAGAGVCERELTAEDPTACSAAAPVGAAAGAPAPAMPCSMLARRLLEREEDWLCSLLLLPPFE